MLAISTEWPKHVSKAKLSRLQLQKPHLKRSPQLRFADLVTQKLYKTVLLELSSNPSQVSSPMPSLTPMEVRILQIQFHTTLHFSIGSTSSSSVFLEASSDVENEFASADSAGSSAVEGVGSADAFGSADALTEQAVQCRGYAQRCCRGSAVFQAECGCRRGRCRYEGIQQRRGKTILWRNTSTGQICQC